MTFPFVFKIGAWALSAHLVFETLAFVIGFRYFLALRKRNPDPIPDANRVWILIGATFGALVFSRLIGSLEDPIAFFSSDTSLLYYYSNKTILGALLGGLLCVEGIKKIIGEHKSSGDLFVYPLILAIIIGRIGCFSSGVYEQTYGIETHFFLGLDLGDGLSRHPVALYEIAFLLLLMASLKKLEQFKQFKSGIRFKLFLITYIVFRFLLDFIKPGFRFSIGLTTIQISCLLGLLYYCKTIYAIFFNGAALNREYE